MEGTNSRIVLRRSDIKEMLGVGILAVDRLLRREVDPIPSIRVGHNILIPADQFEKWLATEGAKAHSGWDR